MWHDAGWCRALGTSLLQAWHFVFKPILVDLADCCGSIASVLDSSWLWQISNLLLCFCKSIWIQADCSRSISMCFLRIFADLSCLLQFNLWGCKQIKLPVLPSLQMFQTFLASIFPLLWFSVTASRQLLTGLVPIHGVAMDTSMPWPEVLRSPANH